jgi:hypothetical protein
MCDAEKIIKQINALLKTKFKNLFNSAIGAFRVPNRALFPPLVPARAPSRIQMLANKKPKIKVVDVVAC